MHKNELNIPMESDDIRSERLIANILTQLSCINIRGVKLLQPNCVSKIKRNTRMHKNKR